MYIYIFMTMYTYIFMTCIYTHLWHKTFLGTHIHMQSCRYLEDSQIPSIAASVGTAATSPQTNTEGLSSWSTVLSQVCSYCYLHMHVYVHMHMYTSDVVDHRFVLIVIYIFMHVYVYMNMHIHMHVYVHVYMYVYVHSNKHRTI